MDELYKDLLKDGKHERHLLVMGWIITAVFAICAIVGLSMFFMNKMSKVIEETNTIAEYELITDNNSMNNGNITVTR